MKSKYRLISPNAYDYRVQTKEHWWQPWRTIYWYYRAFQATEKMKNYLTTIHSVVL